ncbi:MAG: protein translocase subunit SecD, partial [Candidatus Omnitrophica bacterium]|nr:protein translocase subunit SecD [Candidatus Omnitrophota bacterium]
LFRSEIIRNRIDQFGVSEPSIQLQGLDRIVVQLPGVTDRARAKDIVGKTAHLEFKIVADDPELLKKAMAGEEVEGYEKKKMKERDGKEEEILLEKKAVLTGDMLINATTEFSQQGFGMPYVSLELNDKGADIFADVTSMNIGKRLAIVLDGEVSTAPVIREKIPSGRAQISGNFSLQEAKDIALILRAGALPAPVKIIEERSVGAALGKDSIEKGIKSVLIGGVAVILFMVVYYLLGGVIADIALGVNFTLIMAAMSYFHATLTLPGIAGLILTIGMAVDANVLIFERIREELNLGKNLRAAVSAGYEKAFLTILDSNVTTLITALILFQFGTGPVKGFATTLSIGILTSVFSAVFVTRLLLDVITVRFPKMKSLPMLRILKDTAIPFIKMRKFSYILSIVVIALGMSMFVQRGEKNYGVDFTGGTLYQLEFRGEAPVQEMRKVLGEIGLSVSTIQRVRESNEIILRTPLGDQDSLMNALTQKFGEDSFQVLRVEEVGPATGKDLQKIAFKALLFAILGILIYIGIRFEFKFATTAVIALVHDVLMALSWIAITGREISLPVVAAILTVVGYSINDTIVVFDRIREDRKIMRKISFGEIIDLSINQTLSRTILTSTTTLLVVLSLFLFGGPVINDFAFVLLIGVVFGTYSSVFIAAPLLYDWPSKKAAKKKR